MSFAKKIDEWMKEVEARPESAATIVRLVVRRLRELAEQNEELLAENIALQNGTRVEEYQKRIAHLEYQLEMIRQRFGMDPDAPGEAHPPVNSDTPPLYLLVYNPHGRILRIALAADLKDAGQISGEMVIDHEPPRLLVVHGNESLLLLFTSGRVEKLSLDEIPLLQPGGVWSWENAALPNEPHAGELLACIVPVSHLPVSDYLLQASRRGFVKKTLAGISESIFDNHFIGKGATEKSDQPFDLMLARKGEVAALVTYEGKVITLDIGSLSYATEERMKLSATDYVIASFILPANTTLLCITQNGKIIQREGKSIEPARSASTRGQALIPPTRLEQGVRFMGAAAVMEDDQVALLDAAGRIHMHDVKALIGAGSVEAGAWILSMGRIHAEGGKRRI